MYKKKFIDALERTRKFDLDVPEIKYMDGSVLTNKLLAEFPYLLRNQVGEVKTKDIAAQCLYINSNLKRDIEKIFNVPCYYTIGYIKTADEKTMFYQSEEDLLGMLKNVVHTPRVLNIHAWLTFATMEIIDISIATTIQVAKGEEPDGRVLAENPDDRNDYKYIPMIIGDDFLEKAGM